MYKLITKAISLVVMLAMIVTSFTFISSATESEPTIYASNVTGDIGETVEMTISLRNNPGIVSMTLYVNYDDAHLKLISVVDSGLLPGQTHKPEMENPYTLAWANDTALENYMVEGVLVTFSFEILDTANAGESYDVEISYDPDNYDIFNYDVEPVNFAIENGKVTVNGSESDPLVVNPNVDLGLDASVISSDTVEKDGWLTSNLNNGKLEETSGFSTNGGTEQWVGYDLSAMTRMNTVILFSANSTDERDANWSGIPKKFEIQSSNNNSDWTTLLKVDNSEQTPEKLKAYTYTFKDTDARYIRVLADECYPKESEGGNASIQLAEMQVCYSLLTGEVKENMTSGTITTEGIGAWVSVRKKGESFDMRFLLATTDVVLPDDQVTITFVTTSGATKTVTRKISNTGGEGLMGLYDKAWAAGIEYSAQDCLLFGCVITDIPINAFQTATMTVSRNGLIVMTDAVVAYESLGL